MKVFFILSAILAVSSAADNFCYDGVDNYCGPSNSNLELKNCTADYSGFKNAVSDLQTFSNKHLCHSYEYLQMATLFGNYKNNREGFAKLFRKLSDETWGKTIELVKYITKRGGQIKFFACNEKNSASSLTSKPSELSFIAKALDMQKSLAVEAHHIHGKVSQHGHEKHDPEVGHYLEEEFMREQAETIRRLAGHTSDLKSFVKDPDSSLSLFLFDEYLSKSV